MASTLRPFSAGPLVALLLFAPLVAQQAPSSQQPDPEEFVLAVGMLDRGLHAEAATGFERFLENAPRRHRRIPEAWYRLGVCRSELGQGDAAAKAYRRALREDHFEFETEARYRLATTLQGLDRFAEARKEFQTLVDGLAADHYLVAAAYFGLGEVARDLKDDAGAIDAFVMSADRGVQNGGDGKRFGFFGGYQAGFALLREERFGDAERVFEMLAQQYSDRPELGELRFFQGDAAYRAGRPEQAEAAWRAAVRAGGAHLADARLGIAWCRRDADDPRAAIAAFDAVVEHHPGTEVAATARLEAGRLRHVGGDHRGAVATLSPLLDHPQHGASALEIHAAALLALGDADAASAGFARVAGAVGADDPRAARLQYGIAEAHAARGAWDEALAAYTQAARSSDPGLRGDARYAAVVALHELGKFAESAQQATAFARDQPQHPLAAEAAFAAAENRFALEQWEAARKAYDGLAADHPRRAFAMYKAAWATYLGGDAKAAAARFAKAAEDEGLEPAQREEALSLVALARFESDDHDGALEAADRYRARHGKGAFLARTERIAGRVMRARGELDRAAERFARAASVESDPGKKSQLDLEQADALFERGDFEGARTRYAEASRRDDAAGARALEGLAWCEFELGRDRECLRALESATGHGAADDTLRASMHELAVSVHHRAEAWSSAAQAAERFLEAHPQHPRASAVRYALGVAQVRSGDHASGRQTLSRVAKDGGEGVDRGRALHELAWACKADSDAAAMVAAYRRLLALDGAAEDLVGEARIEVATADLADAKSDRRKREVALSMLREVQGVHRARALYKLGFAHIAAEEWPPARDAFEAIVGLGKDEELHFEARFMAAETSMRAGDPPARALAQLDALLTQAPRHERAHRARLYAGECAIGADDPERAIAVLEPFVRAAEREGFTRPERARGHLFLGRAYADRSEHERAEREYTEATKLSEGEVAAEAQFRIGDVRAARGDHDGAVDAYVKLSILYAHEPWVPRALERAAATYRRLQQPEKAARFQSELLERYPDSPEAKRARTAERGGD